MEEIKKVSEMYGILLILKEEYETYWNKEKESFDDYAQRRIAKLYKSAFDWLIDDDREEKQKIAQ